MRLRPHAALCRVADALELLYPRACTCCGEGVTESFRYLCWNCATLMHYLRAPLCACCGEPVEGRVDGAFVCQRCETTPRWFDRARSAARHEGVLRTLVHTFKYREGTWMTHDLVTLLAGCFRTHFAPFFPDVVTCVPLHPARRRMRGFNQAALLGRSLARRHGLPFSALMLRRVRLTETQTRLKAVDRAGNVQGAFRIRRSHRVAGRSVLLVDDVMTTGATVSECARMLKEAGAQRVDVITVARG